MEELGSQTRQESDVWLAIASKLTDSLYNYSQSREYTPLISERTEGFTEKWQCHDADNWNTSDPSQNTAPLLSTPYPQQQVTLLQFEPAWQEQLALRIAGIDFVVVNSKFASTEATGLLPCIYDLRADQVPAIVGRRSKGDACFSSNSILTYLKASRGVDFDKHLPESLGSLSKLYENLIATSLASSLNVLRYQDLHSWHQIYRRQYQAAGGGRLAWLQTWNLRIWGQFQLSFDERQLSLAQAVRQARQVFEMLEQQLASNDESSSCYLLGTRKPVMVDILLWGSLATALANVHLVVVLADFPALCDYAQRIWNSYFATTTADDEWREWNIRENAQNAFCSLPMLPNQQDDESGYSHAIELMEKLSLQRHDLKEQLVLAKDEHIAQDQHLPRSCRPFHTWHRWRMGDNLYPKSSTISKEESATEETEKLRQYKRNDEIWMAAASVGILASIFLFGASRPQ